MCVWLSAQLQRRQARDSGTPDSLTSLWIGSFSATIQLVSHSWAAKPVQHVQAHGTEWRYCCAQDQCHMPSKWLPIWFSGRNVSDLRHLKFKLEDQKGEVCTSIQASDSFAKDIYWIHRESSPSGGLYEIFWLMGKRYGMHIYHTKIGVCTI